MVEGTDVGRSFSKQKYIRGRRLWDERKVERERVCFNVRSLVNQFVNRDTDLELSNLNAASRLDFMFVDLSSIADCEGQGGIHGDLRAVPHL